MPQDEDVATKLFLEWTSNPVHDMVADSIVAIVLESESSPASVKGITFSRFKKNID